jgi:23S rRNA pseudouridine1911/1915/1917 synthase
MNNDDADIILVSEEEAGERLDKFLANRFINVQSRTYFQFLIEKGRILVNGALVKKREKVSCGDEVQINFLFTSDCGLKPEAIPLDIIYEDEDILVINKPAGMVVHPAHGNWTGTFVNALLYHCKDLFTDHEMTSSTPNLHRPGIVHRLDKETTGVLIAAKNSLAQQRLIELFANRQMEKEYWAICLGNPGDVEINAPIGRHPVNRKQMAVLEEGKEAFSKFKTRACDGKISLVQVFPKTGRTHQIRVHLKHIGTPVLGDSLYGNAQVNKKYEVNRQMLHARALRFKHPITNKLLEFVAEVPADMLKLIQILEKKR